MLDILVKGGWVMVPLFLCSVVAVAVTFERLFYFFSSRTDAEELLDNVKLALEQGNPLEAMQIVKKRRGPVAAVLAAGIAHYNRPFDEIEEHMETAAQQEVFKLERRLPILESIVGIAPLLGLLGTVLGIIDSFNVLAAMQGISQPAALSSGVAEALITTAAGLMIAIPTMAVYYFLSSLVDKAVAQMNRCSAEVLTVLSRSENT